MHPPGTEAAEQPDRPKTYWKESHSGHAGVREKKMCWHNLTKTEDINSFKAWHQQDTVLSWNQNILMSNYSEDEIKKTNRVKLQKQTSSSLYDLSNFLFWTKLHEWLYFEVQCTYTTLLIFLSNRCCHRCICQIQINLNQYFDLDFTVCRLCSPTKDHKQLGSGAAWWFM